MPEIAAGVQRFPFDLPPAFLTRLAYERAVGAPFQITDELRDQLRRMFGAEDLAAFAASVAARRPRRWVALFWEPAGDELAWTDGQSSGAGQLDHWLWLDWLQGRGQFGGPIWAWLVEHQVDLGLSDSPATHALVVDRQTGQGWVAPMATARAIVRAQRLEDLPMA